VWKPTAKHQPQQSGFKTIPTNTNADVYRQDAKKSAQGAPLFAPVIYYKDNKNGYA